MRDWNELEEDQGELLQQKRKCIRGSQSGSPFKNTHSIIKIKRLWACEVNIGSSVRGVFAIERCVLKATGFSCI